MQSANFYKFKKVVTLALAAICASLTAACGVDYSKTYFYKEQIAFSGTQISLSAYMLGKNAEKAYGEMFEFMREVDGQVSLTRTDTPLYAFNESKTLGEKIKISEHTYKMLTRAEELHAESQGAFNIAVYNLSRLWMVAPGTVNGYSTESDEPSNVSLPLYSDIEKAMLGADMRIMNLSQENGEYFVSKSLSNPDLPDEITDEVAKEFRVDLGALAKGYCTDICLEIAKKHEIISGIINISGNVMIISGRFDGEDFIPWELYVENPRPRPKFFSDPLCATLVSDTVSVVTSGDYQRFYKHDSGIMPNHIINPFTGCPAGIEHIEGTANSYRMLPESLSSVTLITAESARADALSTAVFVMGMDEGVEFLKTKNDIKAILFSESYAEAESHGKMAYSGSIELFDTDSYDGFKSYFQYTF